jgi:kynureninase
MAGDPKVSPMPPAPSRAEAEERDRDDELAAFRDRFVVAEDGPIYVDGNSLGRLPRATVDRLRRVVEGEWGGGLVGSWERWIDLPTDVGDRLGAALLGAGAGQVLVADSTTVNLYKLATAALESAPPGRTAIVTDGANFPTDRFVLQGIADRHHLELRLVPDDPTAEDIADATAAGDVALVCLSHVAYRSGALLDLGGISDAARRTETPVLWDLSHSVGAVPIDLDGAGVDLAVGCTYKYVNAGPGAPAFLYVRRALQEQLRSPIQGWFGAADQFAMGPRYEPIAGIARFAAGTPPIPGLAAVDEGVRVLADAGIERLRRKSLAIGEQVITHADAVLAPLGFELATPRDPDRRGSHVSLRHPEAWRLCRALIAELGVVPDFREPDLIRIGITPAYLRFVDAWDAVDRLRVATEERRFERFPRERSRVT